MKSTLVLLRHGQSIWNQENIFTGWVDVPLSKKGEEEASQAGKLLSNYSFDAVFCSNLSRAKRTAEIALKERLPDKFICDEALNERHYGKLQGKNKDDMRKKFGVEQVHIWRRSFDVRPPQGESLKDTCHRVLPYYHAMIEPRLKEGQTILISAHGNSLRALIMYLEGLDEDKIVKVEVPTGVPIVYSLGDDGEVLKKEVLIPKGD